MTLVIDASVAVKWVVAETDTEAARELLRIPEPLIAPDWLLVEAASTFWKKVKRSELLAVHAERHLDDLPTFFMELHPASELVRRAFDLSVRLRHSPYDCLYLALALREQAMLVTADVEFHNAMVKGGMAEKARLLS